MFKELARKKDRDFINDSDDDRPHRSKKRQSRVEEEDPARFKGKGKCLEFQKPLKTFHFS
jgi:hypothetical protein